MAIEGIPGIAESYCSGSGSGSDSGSGSGSGSGRAWQDISSNAAISTVREPVEDFAQRPSPPSSLINGIYISCRVPVQFKTRHETKVQH